MRRLFRDRRGQSAAEALLITVLLASPSPSLILVILILSLCCAA